MGTNYYYRKSSRHEKIHIGKSSGGWCFALHVYNGNEGLFQITLRGIKIWPTIQSLNDWKKLFEYPGAKITDEYGNEHTPAQMLNVIENRSWAHQREWTPEEYEKNQAEPGPNGLVRSKIDGKHCVGHGSGTWDLMVGEFF